MPSELQTCFAGRIGECLDPTVVLESASVEDDGRHACVLGALGDQLADFIAVSADSVFDRRSFSCDDAAAKVRPLLSSIT